MKLSRLTKCAVLASIYIVLSLLLGPISFGLVQIRVAEALNVFCLFSLDYVWAVSVGCLLTNLLGNIFAFNPLGAVDVVFGTFATFLAAILIYELKHIKIKQLPIVSLIMPAIINGIVLTAEAYIIVFMQQMNGTLILYGTSILISELICMFGLGLPLYLNIRKKIND